jgi:hypothetical protein
MSWIQLAQTTFNAGICEHDNHPSGSDPASNYERFTKDPVPFRELVG